MSPKQLPVRPHGEGDGVTKPPRSRIPAFLRVIVSPGGLITCILRMICTWAVAARRWGALIIRILRMMVHLGVFMLQLGGL